MTDWIELQKTFEFSVYAKRDLVLVKGEGARVWDTEGNEYIDCVAGLGVLALGHCHPVLVDAVTEQVRRLTNCSNLFYNDKGAGLFQRLNEISPKGLNRAYFCNSGAESVEAAIKFARYTTKKTDFICAEGGFHGRTMGAVSATHNPEYRKDFQPLVPGFHFAPFNDFDALAGLVTIQTAGILLEVVQGDGGVNMGEESYFQKVQNLCREKGILLIIDEVQTGLCRTGKWFACDHYGLEPDIMCLAKAMAGGIPMGAVLCTDRIQPLVRKHGSTFGGNPLACAASLAVIDFMIAEKLYEQVYEKGIYFRDKLSQSPLPKVRQIRHLGLMIGIELTEPAGDTILKLQQKGLLVMSAGEKVIRLLPPLTISFEELDLAAERLTDVLGQS
jgi:acetylornithine/LysW-gamma-L-lysine aminotransferase